jgi:3-oxoacyl-(acyl-carrier-protein) synthase
MRRMEHELMKRRVVVTGLGLVTPIGNTVEAAWAGLMAGRSGAGPITKFDAGDFPVRFACEVKGFDPLNYVEKNTPDRNATWIMWRTKRVRRLWSTRSRTVSASAVRTRRSFSDGSRSEQTEEAWNR